MTIEFQQAALARLKQPSQRRRLENQVAHRGIRAAMRQTKQIKVAAAARATGSGQ